MLYYVSAGLVIGAAFFATIAMYDFIVDRLGRATTGYVQWMIQMFDKMFLTVSARQCVLMIAASTLVSFAIAAWATQFLVGAWWKWVLRIVLVLVVTVGIRFPTGWQAPRKILNYMWRKRIDKFDLQMLDALTFMSNSLKSGLSLLQGFEMVVKELPNPVSQEIALVLSQQKLGVRLEEALVNLEERIDSEDIRIIVTSINILRESGGNLAEVFETIAKTMRERRKVEAKIKALTAQGVTQGYVICALPFVLGYVLYLIDPVLISRMWQTALGWVFLGVMLTFQYVGFKIIKKIVTIDI